MRCEFEITPTRFVEDIINTLQSDLAPAYVHLRLDHRLPNLQTTQLLLRSSN